jgi:hypothetical protein
VLIGLEMAPSLKRSFITDCKRSDPNKYSKGDKGSPCQTPLLQTNCLPGIPFRRIAEVPELKISLIHPSQTLLKPMLHHLQNDFMLNSIKSLGKIKLENNDWPF